MLGFEAPVEVTFDALFVDSSSMCCSAPFFFQWSFISPRVWEDGQQGGLGLHGPRKAERIIHTAPDSNPNSPSLPSLSLTLPPSQLVFFFSFLPCLFVTSVSILTRLSPIWIRDPILTLFILRSIDTHQTYRLGRLSLVDL